MKKENKNILIKSYPGWFTEDVIKCGDGWLNLLIDLCEAIVYIAPPEFRFIKVKEKFGVLRISSEPYEESIARILTLVEKASANICEKCGANGATKKYMKDTMWVKSLCEKCHEKSDSFYEET